MLIEESNRKTNGESNRESKGEPLYLAQSKIDGNSVRRLLEFPVETCRNCSTLFEPIRSALSTAICQTGLSYILLDQKSYSSFYLFRLSGVQQRGPR